VKLLPAAWKKLGEVTGPALRPGGLALTQRALQFCSFPLSAKIIDAGCGPGESLRLISAMGYQALGIDCDPQMVRLASSFGETMVAPIEQIPLPNGTVDGLFCECVLNLVTNRSRALTEFGRVLKDGGFLVVSDLITIAQGGPEGLSRPGHTRSPSQPSQPANGTEPTHLNISQAQTIGSALEADQASLGSSQTAGRPSGGCVAGAVSRQALTSEISEAGFEIVLTEDHRPALTQLAAALVWAYGRNGLAELCGLGGNQPDPIRPGGCGFDSSSSQMSYILVIARPNPNSLKPK
jgi:SAM-dependent methyltransferase